MIHADDIFARLRRGEALSSNDAEYHKLREVSFATRKLLLQLNQSADPAQIRALLGQVTGAEIDVAGGIPARILEAIG